MNKHRQPSRRHVIALAATAFALSQAHADPTTATWTGSNGDYATPGNWSNGTVPFNGAGTTYIVQIGTGKAVAYTTPGAQAIDQFGLATGSSFSLSAAGAALPAFTVLGQALIGGAINVDKGSFTALGAGSDFTGNATSISATNGGVVRMAGTTFNASGLFNATVLNATGVGSLVQLAGVKVLSLSNNDFINASAGGRIEMPSLTTVFGAHFKLDGATAALGPLQSATNFNVDLQNASMMTLGGYAGSATLRNSTFSVAGGSKLNGATWVGTLNVEGLYSDLLKASGGGSLIDMSGLTRIDVSRNGKTGITASTGAHIDLSGIKEVDLNSYLNQDLTFTASGGASIDLSSLQTVLPMFHSLDADYGALTVKLDGASAVIGPLQLVFGLNIGLRNASTITMGGYAGNAGINNATFTAEDGSKLNAARMVGGLYDRLMTNPFLVGASGNGSLIDLSGISQISVEPTLTSVGQVNFIGAGTGAKLDLSGVKSVVTIGSIPSALVFSSGSGGNIDLSALQTISDSDAFTTNRGYTTFFLGGATAVVGPLQKANRLNVLLTAASTMMIGGYAGSADVTDATFSVYGGSKLNAAKLVGTLTDRGYLAINVGNTPTVQGTDVILSAADSGSLLDLSGLTRIDTGQTYLRQINATTGSSINLSGLNSVFALGSLSLNASSGANINLSSLEFIDTQFAGTVTFNMTSGGSVLLHGFNAVGPGVTFNLSGAGSRLTVSGSLGLTADSTLIAGSGTRLDISSNFVFLQTVEAKMNLDRATLSFAGGVLHELEVGGRRNGLPTGNAPVTGNFAMGQLLVGRTGEATAVRLVDDLDNGNRVGSGTEALYLNGDADGNGLRLLGGSTLVIGGFDVYSFEGGHWLHLNDLFQNGATSVAFDQGFVSLVAVPVPEPAPVFMLLAGLGFVAWRRRAATAHSGCGAQ